MSDLTCIRVRRSKFIDRDVVFDITSDKMEFGSERRIETSVKLRKEFTELGMAFHRHRVELRFTLPYGKRNTSTEWKDLKEQVKDFCDSRLAGYWTWRIKRLTDIDTNDYNYEMDLSFEHESDMDLWLKEQGLMIRLAK